VRSGARIHNISVEPAPRGALIFWDYVQGGVNYGHIVISNGGGRCTTTIAPGQGYGGGTISVDCSLSYFGRMHCLGWVNPITKQ
jgi:hypothetical protein